MAVNARLLAMIKGTVSSYLSDTCTIEKQASGIDAYGGQVNSWAVVATGVSCRVIMSTKRDDAAMLVGDQEALKETYTLIVPVGTALDVDQRITVDSAVYYVISISDKLTDKVFLKATLTRARAS